MNIILDFHAPAFIVSTFRKSSRASVKVELGGVANRVAAAFFSSHDKPDTSNAHLPRR